MVNHDKEVYKSGVRWRCALSEHYENQPFGEKYTCARSASCSAWAVMKARSLAPMVSLRDCGRQQIGDHGHRKESCEADGGWTHHRMRSFRRIDGNMHVHACTRYRSTCS